VPPKLKSFLDDEDLDVPIGDYSSIIIFENVPVLLIIPLSFFYFYS
jgi:hypothetical protein